MGIVEAVVSQHAEEASFLWLLRARAVTAPHYDLADLAKLDGRIDAHLDGLRIAGAAAWPLLAAPLDAGDAGDVFAAAVRALESGEPSWWQTVLAAVDADAERAPGLVSALGWLEWERVAASAGALAQDASPLRRAIGIAGAAVHRRDPGAPLRETLDEAERGAAAGGASDGAAGASEVAAGGSGAGAGTVGIDPWLAARAFKAVGELGLVDLRDKLRAGWQHDDRRARYWAAWASARLGDGGAAGVLMEMARTPGLFRDEATAMAMRVAGADDGPRWYAALVALGASCARQAAIAAGALGDPALVPWLIEQMRIDETARVAGESFTAITGADLALLDLDRDQPEDFAAGPTEDPADEDVALDPDEDLPWPDASLVSAWWAEHAGSFRAGTRYLVGAPLSADHAAHVLRTGLQRHRSAAALTLALSSPDSPLFETRAPATRQ